MARKKNGTVAGAWLIEEAVWGESQRVRLITGGPGLIEQSEQIRSIHMVGFVGREVLVVQSRDGSWTFPGGRLEGGESLEDALSREIWEEAGARIATGGWKRVAATRIDFLNRVPGRVYRVHPTYLLWVAGDVIELAEEPDPDPVGGVVARAVLPLAEAHALLPPLEKRVLDEVLSR